VTDVADRVERATEQLAARYRHGHDRPLGSYSIVDIVYIALVTALGLAFRRRRVPDVTVKDVVLLGIATHRLSRTLAKDPVMSPLRMPFTRYTGVTGAAELREEVVASGAGHAVGELMTCPFCLAQWVATGFAAGLVMAPRVTRLAMATMSGVALADFLQYGYSAAQQATER
jgi:hypothetical protein